MEELSQRFEMITEQAKQLLRDSIGEVSLTDISANKLVQRATTDQSLIADAIMACPSLVLDHGFVRWRNQRQPALPQTDQGILGSPHSDVKLLPFSSTGDHHQSIPKSSEPQFELPALEQLEMKEINQEFELIAEQAKQLLRNSADEVCLMDISANKLVQRVTTDQSYIVDAIIACPSLVLDHGIIRWRNWRQPALPHTYQGILGPPPPSVKLPLGSSTGDDHQSIKPSPNASDPFRITGDQHELITAANQGSRTHQPLSPIVHPSPSSGRYWPPSAAGQQHCSDHSPNTSFGSHHRLRVADKDRSSDDQHLRASGHLSPSFDKWQTPIRRVQQHEREPNQQRLSAIGQQRPSTGSPAPIPGTSPSRAAGSGMPLPGPKIPDGAKGFTRGRGKTT